MIVRFSLENWMSFRNQVTFSMVASRERQHGGRVPNCGKYQTRLLPIAALYGGNASGKTNFCKALNFAKSLVVKGTQPDSQIPIVPFRLDAMATERPSRFGFELLIDEMMYDFSFAVTRSAIQEERLVRITRTSEKVLYHRQHGKPNFHQTLAKDQFLQFAFQGTRDNQLFLTNSVLLKIDSFRPVYNWFKHTLELVAPDSRFQPFELYFDEGNPFNSIMNEMLAQLDTGITRLGSKEIPLEHVPLPEMIKSKLLEDVREGMVARLQDDMRGERFVVTRSGGELVAKKLVAFHTLADGREFEFDIRHESDGSRRVIDLLPAFAGMSIQEATQKVVVIDEVDRCLHTLLTRRLLEGYLANCSTSTRRQMLLTTHDVLLMDQQLLRRDEMWVTERDDLGASSLFSFSEYQDVRYDKDIRKSYLQGRLGGIPRFLLGDAGHNPCYTDNSEGDG